MGLIARHELRRRQVLGRLLVSWASGWGWGWVRWCGGRAPLSLGSGWGQREGRGEGQGEGKWWRPSASLTGHPCEEYAEQLEREVAVPASAKRR